MMKNRCKVVVKGLNQERVITTLSKHITVYNFKRANNDVSCFEVEYKKQRLLKKMLKKHKIEILEISGYGIKHQLKRLARSYGIMLGIVLSLFVYGFQSVFVLQVRVFGAENALEDQIAQYAETRLVTRVRWQIDTKNLEMELRRQFDDLSFVSVAIVGQTLLINVNNALPPVEMGDEFTALVSDFDGCIEEINLIQGTAAVKKGDIVKKGDVLVFPYVIDSQGQRRQTEPKAEIKATVWLQGSVNHQEYRVERKRSGKKLVYNDIYLNNLLIFSGEKQILFENYEKESEKTQLSYVLLPFYKKTNIIYELIEEEIVEKFEDKKAEIIENARQKALIFFKENDIIKEEYYTVDEGNGWHGVTYVLAVERNIGG